jgi:hypothetical protein
MRKQAYMTPAGRRKFLPVITELELYGEESLGFCLGCGTTAHGVEPDARRYDCESCGEPEVYGLEELAMIGLAIIE